MAWTIHAEAWAERRREQIRGASGEEEWGVQARRCITELFAQFTDELDSDTKHTLAELIERDVSIVDLGEIIDSFDMFAEEAVVDKSSWRIHRSLFYALLDVRRDEYVQAYINRLPADLVAEVGDGFEKVVEFCVRAELGVVSAKEAQDIVNTWVACSSAAVEGMSEEEFLEQFKMRNDLVEAFDKLLGDPNFPYNQ